ncbi:PREDICTED: peptidoglycan-recognition protein LB-like isoform X2 [Nicrophorus vespilloides]|uniref:Peptidoglycan-recognition protein n=1 Tax=Nicrophorus vespilloides TaxID=110193 RepID=A0ABM1NE92_NICVS|nr:PREDICTED: peptidoglycan-recognition protein LB-like isoform X2 [Nicrophorus vespilloides]
MKFGFIMEFICCLLVLISVINVQCCDFDLVSREDWHADPPTDVEKMSNPVPFVIIHHSFMPPACYSAEDCEKSMKKMQEMHQITNGWNDVGYSFAVGGDGRAYEGRGWFNVGAHAPTYNNKSIGICIIGDWRTELPPPQQLSTVLKLINFGVRKGYIAKDYTLHGHRQVRNGTECPGNALLEEISTWEHFSPEAEMYFPPPPK